MSFKGRIFRTLGSIFFMIMAGATVFAQARYRSDTIAYYRDTVSGMHEGGMSTPGSDFCQILG